MVRHAHLNMIRTLPFGGVSKPLEVCAEIKT
jgi:hypothetical protein